MKLLRWLSAWMCGFFRRGAVPRKCAIVEELPDRLDEHTVYVVGENGFVWQVAMMCPCGCRKTLHLPVLENTNPRWRYVIHEDNTVSLNPSVWRRVGCQSHFHLRRGVILWCAQARVTRNK